MIQHPQTALHRQIAETQHVGALQLTVDAYRFMADFEGAVPGASEVECGNYRDMDLPAAKVEAAAMLPVLEALTAEDLHY